jgi:hypothetical protein
MARGTKGWTGGLNSDILLPPDETEALVREARNYIGLQAPASERMFVAMRPVSDSGPRSNFTYDPEVCALWCPGTSRSQMAGRTEAYPRIFPCREGWADAIVQSATISCSERGPSRNQAAAHAGCALNLEMLFATYLFGRVTAKATFTSGPLSGSSSESTFDVGDPNTKLDSNFMASLTFGTTESPCSGPPSRTSMVRMVEEVEPRYIHTHICVHTKVPL